jgi:phage/plasmid-like protein (TIGR03299 family)
MSHELTEHVDGRVEYAYRADHGLPWHGLGQQMTPEEYHSTDAWVVKAGMQWKANRSRVRYGEGASSQIFEGAHVLFRSDTKAPLGIVSPAYKTVQPRDLLDVFRNVLREGGLEMSSAGTLFGGKRFWCTAKIGEGSPVSMRDRIGAYLLGVSSLDGSLKTSFRRSSTRVVCNNTLRMAFAEGPAELTVSHRSHFDAKAVREFMQLNTAAWDSFRHTIARLANKPVDKEVSAVVLQGLFGGAGKDADKVRESVGYKTVLDLFNGSGKGAKLDGAFGTAWGLLNAVTEYADHHVRAQSNENRLASAQWGNGAQLKDRALEALTAL